ncbi:MAG TPA: ISL3 family transposase [Acidimicrobiia bacterium]|nr:ISL3 family transposase [Acidimicrobiia bacterium]
MGDRIEVPLELADFEVLGTELVEGWLEVRVESTFTAACFHCGSVEVTGNGRHLRRIRDRSFGYPTVLVWSQRRFRCRDCGRLSRERHPQLAGRKRISRRFQAQLGELSKREAWKEVACRERVSWWRIADSFEAVAASVDPYAGPPPSVISIDEASFRSRFVYHTVFSLPEQRRVVDLVEGRSQLSAFRGLSAFPDSWKEQIETVVIDLYWPYRKAIEEVLPRARIVADKFHVLRVVDKAAEKVRIRHGRRVTVVGRDGGLARGNNPRFQPEMWRSRWLFLRRHHLLTSPDQDRLDRLFATHPQVGMAWWLKEAFAAIYQATDRVEAERRLEIWVHHVEQSQLPEFKGAWHTLTYWREQILNYFDHRHTNAYAEGITNKIKVMKRRGYGHGNSHRYRRKVLLSTNHQPG